MSKNKLWALTLLIVIAIAGCSPEKAPEKEADAENKGAAKTENKLAPAAQFATVTKAFEQRSKEIAGELAKLRTTKDEAELKRRTALSGEYRRLRTDSSKKLLTIAQETDDADLAVKSLKWIVSNNGINRRAVEAVAMIEEKFLDHADIGDTLNEKTKSSTLQKVVDTSPHDSVKAVAKYFLAVRESDEDVKEKSLLEIQTIHGDVVYRNQELAELVTGPLVALRLRVGKEAPNITGPDIDGVEFSLTDYRGKVVLLDFWGDW